MRKLIHDERVGSTTVVLGLGALILIAAALLLFIWDLRGVATGAAESNRDLRETIQARCTQRQAYDERVVRGAEGDLRFYADLLEVADDAEQGNPDLTPLQRQLLADQRELITEARDRKQAIVREGVLTNCDQYRDTTQK